MARRRCVRFLKAEQRMKAGDTTQAEGFQPGFYVTFCSGDLCWKYGFFQGIYVIYVGNMDFVQGIYVIYVGNMDFVEGIDVGNMVFGSSHLGRITGTQGE